MPSFSIPLSGLSAESTALSAIANNLANQNTVGYKDVRVLFRDLFYSSLGSTGAGDSIQLGAGTEIGTMPGQFTQGSVQATGVPTDVAIQGGGFFILQKNGTTNYARAGNFAVDKNNFLVTAAGEQVMGYPAVNGAVTPGQGISALQLGVGTVSPPTVTSSVQITTNLDSGAAVGDSFATPVTIYDSLGASHVLTLTFTKASANNWNYSISLPAADVSGSPTLATGALAFSGNGTLTTPASDVTGIAIAGLTDGASNMAFTWKLYNGTNSPLSQLAGPSSTSSTQQNGNASGTLVNFSIGSDGTVTGSFSNGRTAALGQLALAQFADVEGLQRLGDNTFNETLASGQAVIGTPGNGGRGTLSGGAVELSNVD